MSGRTSRKKGARGELEVAAVLSTHGLSARRTPNSGGLVWRGDLQGVEGYCIEVKRCERWNVPAWLAQAHAASRGGEVPVLVMRRSVDGGPAGRWHAVIPLEEFARLVAADQREELAVPSTIGVSPNDTRRVA